jgi:hypothetical protein
MLLAVNCDNQTKDVLQKNDRFLITEMDTDKSSFSNYVQNNRVDIVILGEEQ